MEQNFKIAVPDGCTASIKQEEGFVIVSFYLKKWEPKDGDVCVSDKGTIFIFDGNGGYKTSIHAALKECDVYFNGALNCDNTTGYRYATEEEKQRLFDALARKGKRWNAEEKRIEDLPRWRALYGDNYYSIGSMLTVDPQTEIGFHTDDKHYYAGNYFKTREAAEKVACQIREIFKSSKAE